MYQSDTWTPQVKQHPLQSEYIIPADTTYPDYLLQAEEGVD